MKIELAGITISIEPERETDTVRMEDCFAPFVSSASPDIVIRALRSAMPPIFPLESDMVFESADMWSLYRIEGRHCFVQRHANSRAIPDRILVCDADYRRCELFVRSPVSEQGESAELPNPLDYPLGQALVLCYLAQGRGILVHACGVESEGKGYLFAGNSGHGKSTMAGLWKDRGRILTDERLVLRLRDGEVWMYGTPWRGDFKDFTPGGVKLDRVFLLKPGDRNEATPMPGAAASAQLLARSFPPLWDKEGMGFILDFMSQVVSQASFHNLTFTPDQSAVDFVTCLK